MFISMPSGTEYIGRKRSTFYMRAFRYAILVDTN